MADQYTLEAESAIPQKCLRIIFGNSILPIGIILLNVFD